MSLMVRKMTYVLDEVWEEVSPEAKDLIVNLLCTDHRQRFNAEQVMDHPWIKEVGPMLK
jgi:serine/threonine protein kinase